VTLVFLGFIGKWHAEVRLNTKDSQGLSDPKGRLRVHLIRTLLTVFESLIL